MSDPLSPPVQSPLNLIMPLRPPVAPNGQRLADILKNRVTTFALNRIGIVHFGRFFVMDGKFMLFTAFDGKMSDYILDFAMDPDVSSLFNTILSFCEDKDGLELPLPVEKHPQQFVSFIDRHCEPELIWFSGYRTETVESIHNGKQWREAGQKLVPAIQEFAREDDAPSEDEVTEVRAALQSFLKDVATPTARQIPTSAEELAELQSKASQRTPDAS